VAPGGVLQVDDASADPRFVDNPFVTGGGLRFYAGAALVDADNQALGSLCVFGDTPRRLTGEQLGALEALARQVVAQLSLRRQLHAAKRSDQLLRESEARFRVLAQHDPLTGLPNRASFLERMTSLHGVPIGLCFLDLDHFKDVNDHHGHEAGDRVLQHVAQALQGSCAPDVLAARLGGDEFVVLHTGADERGMRELVAAIEAAVERPVEVGPGLSLSVSTSAGWTVTDGSVPPDEALRRADQAMYDKKSARRRRSDVVVDPQDLGDDLRRGLAAGELVVHYQPFYDAYHAGRELRGQVSGAEALVRWQHPTRGLLGPDDFVPLAEQTGLVVELGRHVLASAARQTARWDSQGLLAPGFRTHVNLAAQQLHKGSVRETVVELLRSSGLDPRRLCLEVTESGLLDVKEFTVEAANALTDLGVELALDDFGTGFSSLTQLRTFPFGVVKIDRSFVSGLGSSCEDEAIVESVVTLASRLAVIPVAEGVETTDQLQRLVALGCTRVQGYLMGRPTPGEDWARDVLARPEIRLGTLRSVPAVPYGAA